MQHLLISLRLCTLQEKIRERRVGIYARHHRPKTVGCYAKLRRGKCQPATPTLTTQCNCKSRPSPKLIPGPLISAFNGLPALQQNTTNDETAAKESTRAAHFAFAHAYVDSCKLSCLSAWHLIARLAPKRLYLQTQEVPAPRVSALEKTIAELLAENERLRLESQQKDEKLERMVSRIYPVVVATTVHVLRSVARIVANVQK